MPVLPVLVPPPALLRRLGAALVVAALGASATVTPTTALAATKPAAAPGPSSGLDAAATPQLRTRVLGRTPTAEPLLTSASASGYTPAQVRAYLGLSGTGAGQTIAVVTAYDAPNAAKDLALFSSTFGLPAPPSFRKVNQTGGTRLPPVDGRWALEAALDLQWAHAVAPAADLLLVEASSSALGNLLTAVSWAAAQPRVTVVSGSFGAPEFATQKDQDARCRLTTGVCVFASGDTGAPASYPATNPWALAVGGTTLALDSAGGVRTETAWSGSGGGVSAYSAKPAYQLAATTVLRRAAPDVAYAGDPATGFSVYSSTPYQKQTGWFVMGGTSAGAPQWAGVLAVANGLRKGVGKGPLTAATAAGATPLHSALYSSVVRSSGSLFDVVSGTNGTCVLCTATAGYDAVTGVGSPRGGLDAVLRDLP